MGQFRVMNLPEAGSDAKAADVQVEKLLVLDGLGRFPEVSRWILIALDTGSCSEGRQSLLRG